MQPEDNLLRMVLVRHGETEWTERGLLHGRLDSPLSPTGRRQAALTAQRLRGEHFDALYTSPLGRAFQTADILGQAVGLAPVPLDGLSEMDFGWSEGRPLRFFDPDGSGARLFRPLTRVIFALSAERPGRFARRIHSALLRMQTGHPAGRILVVTHWAVLSMIMALLIDGDMQRWRSLGPWAACGISELQYDRERWRVDYLNDKAHIQVDWPEDIGDK